jgi:hypothetical protein
VKVNAALCVLLACIEGVALWLLFTSRIYSSW